MKVLVERDSFLSNFEVLQHMESIKDTQNWTFTSDKSHKGKHKKRGTEAGLDLEVITRDVLAYFLLASPATVNMQESQFVALGEFLNQFELVKVEKLQILNSLPRSMVHLFALVEECGLRFDGDACESIIQKINDLFPLPQEEEEEEEEEEEGEEGDNGEEEAHENAGEEAGHNEDVEMEQS